MTQPQDGYEPNYMHKFSFKNIVDNFYLKFLEKDFMLIDVYMVERINARNRGDNKQNNRPIKVGSARLPLYTLLKGDSSSQVAPILRDGHDESSAMGNIHFNMQMRNSISTAIDSYRKD